MNPFTSEDLQDLLAGISVQMNGFSQDIEIHGITGRTMRDIIDVLSDGVYEVMTAQIELGYSPNTKIEVDE